MTNPLLAAVQNGELPRFREIQPEHMEPAIDELLAASRAVLAEVTQQAQPSWDTVIAPLEDAEDRLSRAFSPCGHLNSVMNSPAWRAAYNACLPKLSDHGTELGQNHALYAAYQHIAEHEPDLTPTRRKVLDDALRDFRLAGVALPEASKARYKQIMSRLSELGTKFEENLLDATQGWTREIDNVDDLAGLPQSAIELARQQAQNKNKGKPGWLLTLDFPSYHAVITYAENRDLRAEVYRAYATRASEQGPNAGQWDNRPVMEEILCLRSEAAGLLGFSNYAEHSLATKMAPSIDEVLRFLNALGERARPRAEQELAELSAFARERDGIDSLQPWDMPYYAEKLREQQFQLSDEMLRPFFPAPRVIQGLFDVVQRLFGVSMQLDDSLETWHEDVLAYAVMDGEERLGSFYLDLYARENKRGGAWMDECVSRRRSADGLQKPVAFLTCNFTPPLKDAGRPSLLTHREVETLFHEFGHGLHHLLTRIEDGAVAGIHGVPWDAVELPSQFLENWCWEREALNLFARHVDTNEPLPEDLFQRMREARNFHSALQTLRQVEFSLFDFRLHAEFRPDQPTLIDSILADVRRQVAVVTPPDWNRFPNSFSHIFGGGYAAGYYSYKWAEVLSADAFSAFEEEGVFNQDTGRRFRQCILEQGGSREAMDLFREFRGREPSIEPLLRHTGLIDEAA